MEHDFLEIIKTRRSCRKFQDRQISRVELDAVLEAGTYAPSAGGRQSAFIVAVQNKEQRKKLAAMNAAVIGSKSNPFYDAPTYVLVFAPSNAHTAIEDGTCVLENMMLAAHALNLGIFLQFIVYLFVNQFIVNSLLTVRDKFLNIFST